MKQVNYKILIVLVVAFFTVSCTSVEKEIKPTKPNIILILADDAGYADFGFMGSDEIPTPNLEPLNFSQIKIQSNWGLGGRTFEDMALSSNIFRISSKVGISIWIIVWI